MAQGVLILFGKPPVPGRVKTRLAAALTMAGAADLYAAFLEDVVRLPRAPDVRVELHLEPPYAQDPVIARLSRRVPVRAQRGADLAERLGGAMDDAFARGFQHVVVRNTDSPHLPAEREREAFERLARGAAAVFGPDLGGGYYLVGLSRPCTSLFHHVPMSVAGNFEATVARARTLLGRVDLLEAEGDVDVPADLERLRAALRTPAVAARAACTCRALDRLDARLPGPPAAQGPRA